MVVSFLFMSPYWRNIPPIGEWLCYVNTFYLLTDTEELDVDELDKNLVELKEHCEMYAPPKTAFFELLYEKFKEYRNHPNLKELIFKLIRTRDEEKLLQKEALWLDYFSKVKFNDGHTETEQIEADNPETLTGDIDNLETTTCGTDSSETTKGYIDSPETTTFNTDNPEAITGDIYSSETTTGDTDKPEPLPGTLTIQKPQHVILLPKMTETRKKRLKTIPLNFSGRKPLTIASTHPVYTIKVSHR